ncbi:MocR-like transcription factor YczR [Arthrobacter sp. H41]|uniref:MocR-like transcription factor YczR n=1 Tax=Arthrobacter sp. H41 TaxID=1312978 RepID=UPI00047ADC38|nr:PLP-dependent aminotransferase family protein [Arthrobacter sp. H41]
MLVLSAHRLSSELGQWRGNTAVYTALADRIRLLVLDGRLPLGTRLPAERELAEKLGVSRTTVAAAYASLRGMGYVFSTRGSGSVVGMPGGGAPPPEDNPAGLLDFSKAALPAAPQFTEATARAVQELPAYLNGSGYDPVGLPRLRQALADRYAERGLPTTPQQIMVTLGAQHAISLLARTLLERRDSALVEAPSYPHAYEALRSAGRRLVPVAVSTGSGWDEDGMEQAFRRARPAIAYVMPDYHNPTGEVMTPGLRERLLTEAERHDTVVIADETMAELRIDGAEPALPLAAYGPAVLIGSLGKTVWGGLCIGWIRAEPELIGRLVQARFSNDLGTPVLEQLIALELMKDYRRLLGVRAGQLARGRQHLESLLASALPEWEVPHVNGGLSTWVNLGRPASSQLALAARSGGLLLGAGPRFGINGEFERFLRIPFSYPAEDTEQAVRILAGTWAALGPESPSRTSYLPALV